MNKYQETPFDLKKLKPVLFVVLGIIILLSIGKFWVTIPSGSAGVVYRKFEKGVDVKEGSFGPGFHLIAPWNDMIIYKVRQSEMTENLTLLSSNLLEIKMDVTAFYQPVISQLGFLELERGKAYEIDVVLPVLRSVIREVIAKYLPEEINTTKRDQINLEIIDKTRKALANNYVQLNDILVRNITLPEKLKASIEKKLQQEQESLEYEFKLEKETKEASRKRIEAQGIHDFQRIVSQSINENLLRWNGIEATLKLAESTNAKVVVVGSGKDGLHIILGGN